MSEITFRDAADFLLQGGYLAPSPSGTGFIATDKFYKAYVGSASVARIANKSSVPVVARPVVTNWEEKYTQFIRDAHIPKQAVSASGQRYDINKFSTSGMKAFKKALEGGVDEKVLIASTRLYYKTNSMPLKVGNYIGDGAWRSDYLNLKGSIESGTTLDYINTELNADQSSSRYELG